jgi:hypothetical protein
MLMTILLLVPAGWAQEEHRSDANQLDVLTPRAGHELFGTFQDANDKQVVFSLDCGSPVTLEWKQVKQLQVRRKTTLQAKDLPTAVSTSKSVDLNSFTIATADDTLQIESPGHSFKIPKTSLIAINLPPPTPPAIAEPSTIWTLSLGALASLITHAYVQETWGGDISVVREQNPERTDWHHQSTTVSVDALNSLTSQGGASIRFSRYTGLVDHKIFLTKNWYMDILGVGYHDSADNMYLEQDYGGGFGVYPFRNGRQSLDLTVDFIHVAEHFYGPHPSLSFAAAALQEKYSIKLGEIKKQPVRFVQRFAYIPPFNQPNAQQLMGAATLSMPITSTWSMNLNFKDDYIENAPIGKNWLESSVGITYTFPLPK